MSVKLRHPEIVRLAKIDGKVTVEGLAGALGVTLQTIRRDLAELAAAGQLERVHGGAVLPSGTRNIAYEERRGLNDTAKARIGMRCAEMIPNDICLFLSIGTTTEAVAQALKEHSGLMVVTNNTNIAQILSGVDAIQVIVTGGVLRHADGGLTGPIAQTTLEQFRFDRAIIGCSAIDPRGTMLDFDMDEVRALQHVIGTAQQTTLVADTSKFLRHAPISIGSVTALDHMVTDAPLSPALSLACGQSGTGVVVA